MLMFVLFFSLLLELTMYHPSAWQHKQLFAIVNTVLIAFITGVLVASRWNVAAILLALVNLFRIFNLLRVIKQRMHNDYLYRVTFRTTLSLALATLLLAALLAWHRYLNLDTPNTLFAITLGQLVVAALICFITALNIYKTRNRPITDFYSDKELPTVSILLPARNETTDLEQCLRTIIANDYPKMEVIVLDDCSQDKTAEIIRSFAHEGVRFVQGAEPNEHWLAKNQAYERLSQEATGELLLFCGVDVRFGPQTVRSLVTVMLNRNKAMVSVMPRRLTNTPAAAFIQPIRYWWELALPRRLFNRPPVLSTCWLIKHSSLRTLGNFAGVSRNVLPERYFARELVKSDGYSFVRADDSLDVQTAKSLPEQRATALRMRYPQIHRRPEIALLLTLFDIFFLLAPFFIAIGAAIFHWGVSGWIALTAAILLIMTHVLVLAVSNPPNIALGLLNFPVAILTEMILGYESMIKYEFSSVDWKDRNICIPVMHVYPKLPTSLL